MKTTEFFKIIFLSGLLSMVSLVLIHISSQNSVLFFNIKNFESNNSPCAVINTDLNDDGTPDLQATNIGSDDLPGQYGNGAMKGCMAKKY